MFQPGDGDDEMMTLAGAVYGAVDALNGVYTLKAHKKICYMDSTELLDFADKIVGLESILDSPDIIQQKIALVKRFSDELRKVLG